MHLESEIAKIAAELDRLAARIAEARRGARGPSGLDAEVERLCRALEAAPRAEARQRIPMLQTMMIELDLLAADIEAARGAR